MLRYKLKLVAFLLVLAFCVNSSYLQGFAESSNELISVVDSPATDFEFDSSSGKITKYIGTGGDVKIPSTIKGVSVTGIGDLAFHLCKTLKTITIPNSVTSIGEEAFSYSGLTSITIPNSITSISIGAFYMCQELKSITIPNGIKSIGDRAFWDTGLTNIILPDSVTSIGEFAFANSGLTSITITRSATTIAQSAFFNCYNLTIYTSPGSSAEEHAKLNNISISYITDSTSAPSLVPTYTAKPSSTPTSTTPSPTSTSTAIPSLTPTSKATPILTPTSTATPVLTPTSTTPSPTSTSTTLPRATSTIAPFSTKTSSAASMTTFSAYINEPTPLTKPKSDTVVANTSSNSATPTIKSPVVTPVLEIIEYDKQIENFKKEIEINKMHEGTDGFKNDTKEFITKEAEKLIEEISSKKVECKSDSMELKKELFLAQIELASKAGKDIDEFLKAQSFEPDRIIRKRINIEVESTGTKLNICLLKDIATLKNSEIDIKISSRVGNTILYHESLEDILKKDLIIAMNEEKIEQDNTKVKSKINLLFSYSDGTILNEINDKIGLELPYGDGNPKYCAIYHDLINSESKNKNRKTEPNFKTYNLGGHENTLNKTLRVSTATSGKYYIKEDKKKYNDLEGEDDATKDAIQYLSSKGIISGKGSGIFDPGSKLKRSEFVRLVVNVLGIIDEDATTCFIDVPHTAWYYNPVAIADNENLISGYPGNRFIANNAINNQEIVKICAQTLHTKKGYYFPKKQNNLMIYKDNKKIGDWARKYVSLATDQQLVIKRTDGNFNATVPCTRRDAAVILYRLYKKLY